LLDVLGTTQTLGKTAGSDLTHKKATYPSVLGLQQTRALQESLYRQALAALESFDEQARPLREIARLVIERTT
jgi:geranylgeranyl pyrophosphate synthase